MPRKYKNSFRELKINNLLVLKFKPNNIFKVAILNTSQNKLKVKIIVYYNIRI